MFELHLALFVLYVAFVASSATPLQANTPHGTLTLQRLVKRGTKTSIIGSFHSNAGEHEEFGGGIQFYSTPYSLEIKTLADTTLVRASSFSVAAQNYNDEEEEDGESFYEETAIYQILDDVFVEAENRLYRSSEDIHPPTYNEIERDRLISTIQGIEPLDNPREDMQGSIEQLMVHPMIPLLEPAAFALGDDLGITGEDVPAAMPFYAIAMTLTEAYKRRQRASFSLWGDKYSATSQGAYPNCDTETCPPCKEDECYGLCGYGCTCWKHLCKDCCYHKGCRDHDKCCRRDGFFSPSCIFPLWFRCNKRFKCRLIS